MHDLSAQLEMFGLDGARRLAEGATTSARERSRLLRRIDVTHELMSELPAGEDLSFLHSGLCQTCLPHSRPGEDHAVWQRKSGRFSLTVQPGVRSRRRRPIVGVPYGPKARLILIHLQTEGMRSRTVNLGASFSAFMRSLGLAVTGGKRGTIGAVREQSLRISQCSLPCSGPQTHLPVIRLSSPTRSIVDRLELWNADRQGWSETVELSERFHAHLREHAVPLDRRGIAHLSSNSLGLDLYALFAYRLPRLERDVHLRWVSLLAANRGRRADHVHAGAAHPGGHARRLDSLPHARIEVTPHGLLLKPSAAAVPKTAVAGMRLIDSQLPPTTQRS